MSASRPRRTQASPRRPARSRCRFRTIPSGMSVIAVVVPGQGTDESGTRALGERLVGAAVVVALVLLLAPLGLVALGLLELALRARAVGVGLPCRMLGLRG